MLFGNHAVSLNDCPSFFFKASQYFTPTVLIFPGVFERDIGYLLSVIVAYSSILVTTVTEHRVGAVMCFGASGRSSGGGGSSDAHDHAPSLPPCLLHVTVVAAAAISMAAANGDHD